MGEAEAGKMLLFLLQLTSAAQPVYTGLVGDVDLDLENWTPDQGIPLDDQEFQSFLDDWEPMDPSCTLILTQECSANEISCDMGTSEKGCWLGNYCSDMLLGCVDFVNSGEPLDPSCSLIPTQECSANEISCDRGTSEKGCWLGNYCADMLLGCLDIADLSGKPVSGLSDGWKSKRGKDEMSDALERKRGKGKRGKGKRLGRGKGKRTG